MPPVLLLLDAILKEASPNGEDLWSVLGSEFCSVREVIVQAATGISMKAIQLYAQLSFRPGRNSDSQGKVKFCACTVSVGIWMRSELTH